MTDDEVWLLMMAGVCGTILALAWLEWMGYF